MPNPAVRQNSAEHWLRRLLPRVRTCISLSVAAAAVLSVMRCTTYGREGRLRRWWWQPVPQLVDSLGRPTAAYDRWTGRTRLGVPVSKQSAPIHETPVPSPARAFGTGYKPELFTKITIVSDTDVAPRPISLPRDGQFQMYWGAGIEDSAVVSALVDTKGKVKEIKFRLPGPSPWYDSAVARSVRASTFAPLRSDGLRVEAWVRLKYVSRYSAECGHPTIIRY